MDNSVIVSLRDIVVEFDGQRILDGLNLDIHDKEFVQSPAEGRGHYRCAAL